MYIDSFYIDTYIPYYDNFHKLTGKREYNTYDKEIYGNSNRDCIHKSMYLLINQIPVIRNDQLIGFKKRYNPPERANGDANRQNLIRTEINYKLISKQDNPIDTMLNVQANKGQLSPTLPVNLKRLIEYIRDSTFDEYILSNSHSNKNENENKYNQYIDTNNENYNIDKTKNVIELNSNEEESDTSLNSNEENKYNSYIDIDNNNINKINNVNELNKNEDEKSEPSLNSNEVVNEVVVESDTETDTETDTESDKSNDIVINDENIDKIFNHILGLRDQGNFESVSEIFIKFLDLEKKNINYKILYDILTNN
jgi:hypothetical protein